MKSTRMSCSWLRKVPTDGYGGDAPAVKQFISSQNTENPMSQKPENIWLLEELPDNKQGTTSGYHSAEWTVAGSKEEHSQYWILSNAIEFVPAWKTTLNTVLMNGISQARCWAVQCYTYTVKLCWETTTLNGWYYEQPAELQLWQTTWIKQLIVLSQEQQQTEL